MAVATWQEAVRAAPGGTILRLEAAPGARHDAFPDGYDDWRHRIRVRVRAPAEDGRANEAVCQLVASALGLRRPDVRLQQGARDRRKEVFVPLERGQVLSVLTRGSHAG